MFFKIIKINHKFFLSFKNEWKVFQIELKIIFVEWKLWLDILFLFGTSLVTKWELKILGTKDEIILCVYRKESDYLDIILINYYTI